MKAGATLIIIAGIAAIGAGVYHVHSANEYVKAVDARVEQEILEADLAIVQAQLLERRGDPAATMRAFYAGPMSEELNVRYARLAAAWRQAHPRLARIPMIPDQLDEMERLGAELDERWGPGVSAVMAEEYARYQSEAPERERARIREQEALAEAERVAAYRLWYLERHGRYPATVPPP